MVDGFGPLPPAGSRDRTLLIAEREATEFFEGWRAKHCLTSAEAMVLLTHLVHRFAERLHAIERRQAKESP